MSLRSELPERRRAKGFGVSLLFPFILIIDLVIGTVALSILIALFILAGIFIVLCGILTFINDNE